MIKQLLNWLIGEEIPHNAGTWDGRTMVLGWRMLQERQTFRPYNSLNWLIALVSLTFVVPILAWSAPQPVQTVEVPVLKTRVLAGQVLEEKHFTFKALQPRYVSDRHIQSLEDVVGLEAVRALRAGVPLYQSHVQNVPAVRQNALVTLTFELPGMRLTGHGKALESGQIGQLVQVRNTDSKQVISGVIVAENTVNVRP